MKKLHQKQQQFVKSTAHIYDLEYKDVYDAYYRHVLLNDDIKGFFEEIDNL